MESCGSLGTQGFDVILGLCGAYRRPAGPRSLGTQGHLGSSGTMGPNRSLWNARFSRTNETPHFQPMPRRDWNGPDFQYVVEYKPSDKEDEPYKEKIVTNPEENHVVLDADRPYQSYDVRVRAKNAEGDAVAEPLTTRGYSGEESKWLLHDGFGSKSRGGGGSSHKAGGAQDPLEHGPRGGFQGSTVVSPDSPNRMWLFGRKGAKKGP